MKGTIYTMLLLLGLLMTSATSGYAQDQLDQYIREGLLHNLVVSEKSLTLERAMTDLQMARSSYLPTISFDAIYTNATGGRSIALPVGDLLNPVYATLNDLTQAQLFPQIENERINFLPRNYYDARFRAGIPILNTEIANRRTVAQHLVVMREQEVELYKRELVKDIKVAYFNYLRAVDAVQIYQNTLDIALEGLRTNQKLLDAGSGLHAYVVRAEAEVAQVQMEILEAKQKQSQAKYYFNMLINRDAEASIHLYASEFDKSTILSDSDGNTNTVREELNLLDHQLDAQKALVKMNKQVFIPKLNAFADLGSQAENMQFNSQSRYMMIGAQLSFPIFEGNRNRLKIRESQIAVIEVQNKREQAEQQLAFTKKVAEDELSVSTQNYRTAQKQLEAAGTYQRLIQRGYSEGVNTYIETIDARSQYTRAQLAEQMAIYKIMIARAQVERELATYPLH